MDDLLKYFEDKRFVRWVYHSDPGTDRYWEKYLLDHPDEREKIELARLILTPLKSKESQADQQKVYELFADIIRKLDMRKKTTRTRQIWISFAKYAAVALIFLTIGIIWTSLPEGSDLSELSEQHVELSYQNEARIILSDGESIVIREKESNIEYKGNGRIIINRHDTIKIKSGSETPEINQLVVPYGKNSSIKLPDGTTAFLNAGSKLIYPSFFEGKTREVFLVGEGFFEVIHNPQMPFIVKTRDLDIKALGTSFNVSAYPADKITEVVLVEGKVGLWENRFKLIKKQQILDPDELAFFDRETMHTTIKNVNVENYITWYRGYLNFESTDLSRIVVKLERYYDIHIKLQDPLMGSKKITGKLKLKEDKEKVLTVLASTASVELIKVNEQNYVLK
jgi:transmembrane sensor